jgi:hypothetical protein
MNYHQRPHSPIYRATTGVECSRCGMRKTWVGWSSSCAAPLSQDTDEHRARVAKSNARRYLPRTS